MPTLTNEVGSIETCMRNATDWLNEYGMCEFYGDIAKYSPDEIKKLERAMNKVDELWVKARGGETSLALDAKRLILEWFIWWRILIDNVRGLRN